MPIISFAEQMMPWLAGAVMLIAIIALLTGKRNSKQRLKKGLERDIAWSPELLKKLECGHFTMLSIEVLRLLDEYTFSVPSIISANADIGLFSKEDPEQLIAIARCKANSGLLRTEQVRSFYGVMLARGVLDGLIITNASFTREAEHHAGILQIKLIDGHGLISIINGLEKDASQQLLLATVANAEKHGASE